MDVSNPAIDVTGDLGTDVVDVNAPAPVTDIEDVNVDVSTGPVGRAKR
jgi:hypothetical protein